MQFIAIGSQRPQKMLRTCQTQTAVLALGWVILKDDFIQLEQNQCMFLLSKGKGATVQGAMGVGGWVFIGS